MDKSAKEICYLVEKHDGIMFGQLCARTTINDARVGALLKHLTDKGKIYRSGSIGQYCYHSTRELAGTSKVRPRDAINTVPKEDIVTSCKAKSAMYKLDQLLRKTALAEKS